MARSFRELRQQSKRMKIGDHVYLITDRLQTGAGVPVMICALQDSTVEVFVEFTHEPKILKVSNRGDILSSNLYAHSILNLVYQTYGEIEHKYGSILNLPTEEIVAQLLRRDLRRRPLAIVSISLPRSSGTMRHSRCGSGWRAFVTSTIPCVRYKTPLIAADASLRCA